MAEMSIGYGSEAHLFRFLGRHRDMLDQCVVQATGSQSIHWLDFKFAEFKTWLDAEWRGLEFLPTNYTDVLTAWKEYWPRTGNPPNWDAVAAISRNGSKEWLLVEAKAHLKELESNCTAKHAGGRGKIQLLLNDTKRQLGVDAGCNWMDGYYQYCNRLAVLLFLVSQGVPARLLNIYFLGDTSGSGRKCPEKEEEWKSALEKRDAYLRLPRSHRLADRIHELFLPVIIPEMRSIPSRFGKRRSPIGLASEEK